ncbi:MAG: hypothetical protein WKF41_13755 [Gaiellaceae bacterium]
MLVLELDGVESLRVVRVVPPLVRAEFEEATVKLLGQAFAIGRGGVATA